MIALFLPTTFLCYGLTFLNYADSLKIQRQVCEACHIRWIDTSSPVTEAKKVSARLRLDAESVIPD